MSRDQRPGRIRIIADPQPDHVPHRRRSDPKASRATSSARPAASRAGRKGIVIALLLFVIGFAVGGIVMAARHLLGISA